MSVKADAMASDTSLFKLGLVSLVFDPNPFDSDPVHRVPRACQLRSTNTLKFYSLFYCSSVCSYEQISFMKHVRVGLHSFSVAVCLPPLQ
jgi:hypothetical protein